MKKATRESHLFKINAALKVIVDNVLIHKTILCLQLLLLYLFEYISAVNVFKYLILYGI